MQQNNDGTISIRNNVNVTAQEQFMRAREKANDITNELDSAKREYARQIVDIIRKMQKDFLKQYGHKVDELEDLEDSIHHVQMKGMKDLERKLRSLHINASEHNESEIKEAAKKLSKEYKTAYFPEDEYEKTKRMQAERLRNFYLSYDNSSPDARKVPSSSSRLIEELYEDS